MVARARNPLESYPQYKQNLKEEAKIFKFKLKPKMGWLTEGAWGKGTRHGSFKQMAKPWEKP